MLHEFGEKPLIPLVVVWIVAFEQAAPVIGESHSLDLFGD